METDIGQPIDYDPSNNVSPPPVRDDRDSSSTPIDATDAHRGPPTTPEEFMYHQALQEQQYMYGQHGGLDHVQAPPQPQKELLASVDKITIIVLFAAFIVGFFLGSSRQPVILKYD
jgi:hypothetical protein